MKPVAYILTIALAISGNSTLMGLVCVSLTISFVCLYSITRLSILISQKDILLILGAIIALIILVSTLPIANIFRFLMSLSFLFGAAFLWKYLMAWSNQSRIIFFENILKFYLLGSLIQFTGTLGDQMEIYKSIVQHPMLSNLDRESNLAILGTRLYGFFAEPSYFAIHYSLMCSALFLSGMVKRALFYLLIGFILCPSPNFLISPFVVAYSMRRKIFLVPRFIVAALIFSIVAYVLLEDRLAGFINDTKVFLSGGYVLTSFSQRIILPYFDILALVQERQLPLPYSCIAAQACPVSLISIPLLTFWAFFSFYGLVLYCIFSQVITGKNLVIVVVFLFISSIFSGGSAFMPHFALAFTSCIFIASLGLRPNFDEDRTR